MDDRQAVSDALSGYAATALARSLPDRVAERAAVHILDTLAATVAGSRLEPGRAGRDYLKAVGDTSGGSTVIGAPFGATVTGAALANGMSAHADETDDSHEFSLTHPGCGNVTAAIAAAELRGSSGDDLLRAVALGYDMGTRFTRAVGMGTFGIELPATRNHAFASHSWGNLVGAANAAGALAGLDESQFVDLTSYVVQELSGITSWLEDEEHVLKAYVFSGMTASTALRLVTAVKCGWAGGGDVVAHPQRAVFDCFGGDDSDFSILTDGLGSHYAIAETNIKRYAVGSPAQAVIQAVDGLIAEERLTARDVASVRIHLHPWHAPVVDMSRMPAVNVQYCTAITFLDGKLGYEASHDFARVRHPDVQELMSRIKLYGDLPDPFARDARVDVTLTDGRELSRYEPAVAGTHARPLAPEQVADKAFELMEPTLGAVAARRVNDLVLNLSELDDVGELMTALRSPAASEPVPTTQR